jgi:hypothetical protein
MTPTITTNCNHSCKKRNVPFKRSTFPCATKVSTRKPSAPLRQRLKRVDNQDAVDDIEVNAQHSKLSVSIEAPAASVKSNTKEVRSKGFTENVRTQATNAADSCLSSSPVCILHESSTTLSSAVAQRFEHWRRRMTRMKHSPPGKEMFVSKRLASKIMSHSQDHSPLQACKLSFPRQVRVVKTFRASTMEEITEK